MKHNSIRYSVIVMLIGFGTLAAGRAHAQENERRIELLSFPYGITSGQTVRTSLAYDPVFLGGVTVAARIQLLDMEGEVIAQSDEMRVQPGKIRFWDVRREVLPAGEPTGRLQVRTRILVTTSSRDASCSRPRLVTTTELINPSTGETTGVVFIGEAMLITVPPPNT